MRVQDEAYFEGLNEKLLAAIPAGAARVLELGCAGGRLGQAYKQRHPATHWTGVDRSPHALARAAERLDHVIAADLATAGPAQLGGGYDVVVIGDLLEHLQDPVRLLRAVHAASAPGARLACCVPNMAHVSVLERLLAGDLSYDPNGLLDETHVRFMSPSSTIKALLDAGWLPSLSDHYAAGHPRAEFVQALVNAAAQIGIPAQTAARNLLLYQMIFDATKAPPLAAHARAQFTVVVPVNNPTQAALNVARSPGLAEVGARVIEIRGASNAADGFERGRRDAATPWIVYCHQDMYFPAGSGHALQAAFGAVAPGDADGQLLGFAGLGAAGSADGRHSGLLIDRIVRFDHPASDDALSLDECAVAMTRTTTHRIDGALGWHLWATDLCLAARRRGARPARIVRVPLYHNSYNDGVLPEAFHRSAGLVLAKYPELAKVPTLCGTIARGAA